MPLKVKKNPVTHPKAEELERYETVRYALNMPAHLHRALKVKAAQRGERMSDIIIDQIRAYLAEDESTTERPSKDE